MPASPRDICTTYTTFWNVLPSGFWVQISCNAVFLLCLALPSPAGGPQHTGRDGCQRPSGAARVPQALVQRLDQEEGGAGNGLPTPVTWLVRRKGRFRVHPCWRQHWPPLRDPVTSLSGLSVGRPKKYPNGASFGTLTGFTNPSQKKAKSTQLPKGICFGNLLFLNMEKEWCSSQNQHHNRPARLCMQLLLPNFPVFFSFFFAPKFPFSVPNGQKNSKMPAWEKGDVDSHDDSMDRWSDNPFPNDIKQKN